MICERCHGTGFVHQSRLARLDDMAVARNGMIEETIPCPDCGGCGTGHCCDGLREQPEGAPDA